MTVGNAKEIPALDKIFKTPFNSRSQKLVSEQKKSHTHVQDRYGIWLELKE